MDRFLLRMPLAGKLIRGLNTARFSRTFSILTASAVPVLEALRISAEVVNNLPMSNAVEEAALRVREGAPIGKSLAARKLFPPMMIHLISSGESSGELEKMLERAATNQEREMDGLLSTMTNLLGALHGGIHGRSRHVHRHCTAVADFPAQRSCEVSGLCARVLRLSRLSVYKPRVVTDPNEALQ